MFIQGGGRRNVEEGEGTASPCWWVRRVKACWYEEVAKVATYGVNVCKGWVLVRRELELCYSVREFLRFQRAGWVPCEINAEKKEVGL